MLGNAAIIDKRGLKDVHLGRRAQGDAMRGLKPQVVIYGKYFDLGGDVKLSLRATSSRTGEKLSVTSVLIPKTELLQMGLKLLPDNYQEAKKALEIYDAKVKDSELEVKLKRGPRRGGPLREWRENVRLSQIQHGLLCEVDLPTGRWNKDTHIPQPVSSSIKNRKRQDL